MEGEETVPLGELLAHMNRRYVRHDIKYQRANKFGTLVSESVVRTVRRRMLYHLAKP